MTWRELEAEIVDIARQHGHELDQEPNGDKIIIFRAEDGGVVADVNITEFAKALAERVASKAVKVKA